MDAEALHRLVGRDATTVDDVIAMIRKDPRLRRQKNAENEPPLHVALARGPHADLEIVEYLLSVHEKGAAHVCRYGRLALHIAIMKGCSVDVISAVHFANPAAVQLKIPTSGQVALTHAARWHANFVTFRFLCRVHPSAVQEEDRTGRLPLHVALRNGAPQSIICLLLHRYPASIFVGDNYGQTPMMVAAAAGVRVTILRLLYERNPHSVHETDLDGNSALHLACKAARTHNLKFLLHCGCYNDVKNHAGKIPLACVPRRENASVGRTSKMCFDTNAVMVSIRKRWNPNNHMLFPPEFRRAAHCLALCGMEVRDRMVDDTRVKFPVELVLSFARRNWFENQQTLEAKRMMQPHISSKGEIGQPQEIYVDRKNDFIARRAKRKRVQRIIGDFCFKFSTSAVQLAIKKVTIAAIDSSSGDVGEKIVARLAEERRHRNQVAKRVQRGNQCPKRKQAQRQLAIYM